MSSGGAAWLPSISPATSSTTAPSREGATSRARNHHRAGAVSARDPLRLIETFAFSPDGRWLAFDSDRNGNSQIFRQPLAGGEPQQLTTDFGAHFWPTWSPDGREIAYHAFRSGGRQLFVMSADGGRPVAVLTDDGDDRSAQWSNDGRGLYYLHNFDTPRPEVRFIASRTLYYLALDSAAHASVWSIDRQGGIPTPLVSFDDPSREWHRYGFGVFRGRFYFTLGDRQSDLWVAEVEPGN